MNALPPLNATFLTRLLTTLALVTVSCSATVCAQSFVEDFAQMTQTPASGTGNSGPADVVLSSGTWIAHNLSTPVGSTGWWGTTSTAINPQFGGRALSAGFNNVAGNNLINNFFMSPVLTLNNGDTISVITRTFESSDFPDRLRVVLSTSGSSINAADFSTTLLSINEELTLGGYPNQWTQFDITLSGLAPNTQGRFAFNYNVTSGGPLGDNSNQIGIDLVSYTAIPEPSVFGLASLAMVGLISNRRRKS
jgi:hypothetical protein